MMVELWIFPQFLGMARANFVYIDVERFPNPRLARVGVLVFPAGTPPVGAIVHEMLICKMNSCNLFMPS